MIWGIGIVALVLFVVYRAAVKYNRDLDKALSGAFAQDDENPGD